jgi:hypothetical protein
VSRGSRPGGFPAAPLDRPTRMVTVVSLLFLGVLLPLASVGAQGGAVILAGLGLAVVVASYGFAPASFEVVGTTLRMRRRLFGAKEMLLTEPAGQVPWTFGVGGLRLIGSGGLFGWYGSFYRPGHGRYRAYLTDRSRIVACATDAGLVLVSPTDPDAFVRATAGVRS